jgi:hypothetical protein
MRLDRMKNQQRALWAMLVMLWSVASQAAAPPLRYDTDTQPGVVRDRSTGLSWQSTPSSVAMPLNDAISYCASLASQGGTWRVPTYKELLTLIDPTRSSPAIDVTAFPNTQALDYWSSSRRPSDTNSAWYISFQLGASFLDATSRPCLVRCVR